MKFSHFFIDRPIFAAVISIITVLVGAIALTTLPIAQYPEVVPPTVVVQAVYPGASPKVIAETVATPIEQEVNGVEDMLYMSSQCTTDGVMALTITFKLGTDLNKAQVLVQNRVAIALPKLPADVRNLGITTVKRSPDLTMVVHLISPNKRFDSLYLSNYAYLQVKDTIARLPGVGEVRVFGARRLLDAHLARSGKGRRAQPDGHRCGRRHPRTKHPGRRRHHRRRRPRPRRCSSH